MSFASGKMAEQRVITLFNKAGLDCKKSDRELLEYDIEFKIGTKKRTAEIKFDMMAAKTGNLAIEFWNSKKDKASGVSATKADYWIICLLDDVHITIWITPTKKLKEYLINNEPKRTVSRAGDNNSELYLYDADDMLEAIFTRLDTIIELEKIENAIKKA